jgi:hypothetical protein
MSASAWWSLPRTPRPVRTRLGRLVGAGQVVVVGGLLMKKNGYVLEQLFSPLVVHTTPEHTELKEIAQGCVTKHHSHHYLGFTETQWKLFLKESPRRVKPLLCVYRGACRRSGLWPCVSSPWASKHWSGSSVANGCGASTSACSPCLRSKASRSIRDCRRPHDAYLTPGQFGDFSSLARSRHYPVPRNT